MPDYDNNSQVERLVLDHNRGHVPAERSLDTPDKVQSYLTRMTAATEDRLREDRRAQQESVAKARTRRVR